MVKALHSCRHGGTCARSISSTLAGFRLSITVRSLAGSIISSVRRTRRISRCVWLMPLS